MIELKLESYVRPLDFSIPGCDNFKKPIIFYLVNQQDKRPFFLSFVIVDFTKKKLSYFFSYNEENVSIINKLPNNERFSMVRCPHSTICINEDEDFLNFMEEEEFFVYVNQKKLIMNVYTIEDFVKDVQFRKFSSTFYKDDKDPNFFFMSIVDTGDMLHIFRMSLTLDSVEEINSFPSHPNPPHALRKYMHYLFLSHDFKYSRYELEKTGKIVNSEELGSIILTTALRMIGAKKGFKSNQSTSLKSLTPEEVRELLSIMKTKYSVKCLPGKILMLDLNTKQKILYDTTGGSPAHFEIDTKDDTIYTSSHNFFLGKDTMTFLEPAVLDKFKMKDGKLELVGSFSYPKGFRYTSHRVFYYYNKPYLCTFGQPNRLLLVDANTMELLSYHDIEQDELSDKTDVCAYINSRRSEFEIVAMEVSENGEIILFVGPQYIYLFNFPERRLCGKIDYKAADSSSMEKTLNEYKLRTVHLNYLD